MLKNLEMLFNPSSSSSSYKCRKQPNPGPTLSGSGQWLSSSLNIYTKQTSPQVKADKKNTVSVPKHSIHHAQEPRNVPQSFFLFLLLQTQKATKP
jgi:hypothetical protein